MRWEICTKELVPPGVSPVHLSNTSQVRTLDKVLYLGTPGGVVTRLSQDSFANSPKLILTPRCDINALTVDIPQQHMAYGTGQLLPWAPTSTSPRHADQSIPHARLYQLAQYCISSPSPESEAPPVSRFRIISGTCVEHARVCTTHDPSHGSHTHTHTRTHATPQLAPLQVPSYLPHRVLVSASLLHNQHFT